MPGPEPKYESVADKQRAYRQRHRDRIRDQRKEAAELLRLATALHQAVQVAAGVGDDLASKCQRSEARETLSALLSHFEGVPGEVRG